MQSVTLGTAPFAVSRLCLGTANLGAQRDREAAFALLDGYAEGGGAFLDVPPGGAQPLVGRWLADRSGRDRVVLATTVAPDPAAPVAAQVDAALRRLGTDRIDLLYTELPDTPPEEALRALADLVGAGKVRAVGASDHTLERLAAAVRTSRALGLPRYQALRQRYTYLRPLPTAELAPRVLDDVQQVYCADERILPVACGVLLGGAYTRADRPPPGPYQTDQTPRQLAALRAVAADLGTSPNTVVLGWLLAAGIVPVLGVSRPEHLDQALAADRLALPPGCLAVLETARNA